MSTSSGCVGQLFRGRAETISPMMSAISTFFTIYRNDFAKSITYIITQTKNSKNYSYFSVYY
ncbi:hypothetical protein SAMN02746095_02095 [Acidocella aminolytica 101 = DSM 11237]|nr:hypothetical protein SAMN02746095_02095 [Acidocella aminolytica 101 = DSM 11237]